MGLLNTIRSNRYLITTWIKFEIQAKYIDTKLGLVWLFLEPILQTLVYTFVFSALLGRTTRGDVPFILFYLAGITMWQFINLNWASAGFLLVRNGRLLSDVKISAEAIVLVEVLGKLIDFGINFLILVLFSVLYGYYPTVTYLFLPILIVLMLMMTLGGTFLLSSLGVFIRDISAIMSMLMRLLFFISGVIISPDMISEKYAGILMLNPLLHLVEAIRSLVIYSELPSVDSILYMTAWSMLIFIVGYSFFKKREGVFVDYQ